MDLLNHLIYQRDGFHWTDEPQDVSLTIQDINTLIAAVKLAEALAEDVVNARNPEYGNSLNYDDIDDVRYATKAYRVARETETSSETKALMAKISRDRGPSSKWGGHEDCPEGRKIIAMNWDAVPGLMAAIDDYPGVALSLLYEITGVSPHDPADAGRVTVMIEARKKWWQKQPTYIQ